MSNVVTNITAPPIYRAQTSARRSRAPPPRRPKAKLEKKRPTNKPKFQVGKKIGRAIGMDAFQQYRLALRDPFHPAAIGVRAPDSICYPTITAHKRSIIPITTSAVGTISAAFLPFPTLSMHLPAGTYTNGVGVTAFAQNTSLAYQVSPSDLSGLFKTYRVVAWGIRITMADNNATAKGQYIIAPILMPSQLPGFAKLDTLSMTDQGSTVQKILNIPASDSSIANLAGAVTFGAQDFLARGGVVGSAPPYDMTALDFRRVKGEALTWNAQNVWVEDGLVNNGTGAVGANTADLLEGHHSAGMLGILLYGTGLPISTNEINVELIYHLEGMPDPTSKMIPTSTPSPPGSTSLIESVLGGITRGAHYFSQGTQMLQSGVNLAGTIAPLYGRYYANKNRKMLW